MQYNGQENRQEAGEIKYSVHRGMVSLGARFGPSIPVQVIVANSTNRSSHSTLTPNIPMVFH